MTDTRSHTGCWTCRVRRKKCDEGPQPCQTCSGLRLPCHGYGPRPDWFDGGAMEKSKVMEFKTAVKKQLKHRRRSKSISQVNAVASLTIPDNYEANLPSNDHLQSSPLDSTTTDDIFDLFLPTPDTLDFDSTAEFPWQDSSSIPEPLLTPQSDLISPPATVHPDARQSMQLIAPFGDCSSSIHQLSAIVSQSGPVAKSLSAHSSRYKSSTLKSLLGSDNMGYRPILSRQTDTSVYDDAGGPIETQICFAHAIHAQTICGEDISRSELRYLSSMQPINYHDWEHGQLSDLQIFQDLLIAVDILTATITETLPHFALKASPSQHMHRILGCHSSVFNCLLEALQLADWNRQNSSEASFSIVECARRALRIDENLKHATIESELDASNPDVQAITRIYVPSISIYLHAAVSGPKPRIPEISSAVGEAIRALSSIHDPKVIPHLSWPIAIAACMAEGEEQRAFFTNLETGVKNTFGACARVCQAFVVARECWRLRDAAGRGVGRTREKGVDWSDAMISLGRSILLY